LRLRAGRFGEGPVYAMPPGAEWSVVASGTDVTFEVDIDDDTLVVVVGGDIEDAQFTERIVGERPLLAELPLAE
jgi:hypothetical protein